MLSLNVGYQSPCNVIEGRINQLYICEGLTAHIALITTYSKLKATKSLDAFRGTTIYARAKLRFIVCLYIA